MPLFSNTCGKLYADTVVFALVNREFILPVEDIKYISLKKSINLSNLLYLALPAAVFILSRLVRDDDTFIKVFLCGIAFAFTVICLVKVQKKYTVRIKMVNGSLKTIHVAKANYNDAQKFIYKATELIKEQRAFANNEAIANRKETQAFSKSVSNIVHH